MTRRVLSVQNYRGYTLTEVLQRDDLESADHVEWEIVLAHGPTPILIARADTKPVAKAKVDAIVRENRRRGA
jgi:hypothetical protein